MRDARRPKRGDHGVIGRLYSIASGLSLLLCVAITALWVRGQNIVERIPQPAEFC
jgi:hypothetical protein